MQEEGVLPSKVTIISILNASALYTCLLEGKQWHAQIVALYFESDVVVGTALIHMYGKCKSLTTARLIYDMIPNKDTFFCTAMLAAYAHYGEIDEAFAIFDEMLSRGIEPDNVSCISILSACVNKTGLDDGRLMHMRSIFCGLDQDARVLSGLINMYGKYGSLEDAIRTLEVSSWRRKDMYLSALSACANQPDLVEGRRVHTHVVEIGIELEVPVGNALINMYSKCGILQEARAVFEKLPEQDIVSWTVMITSHAQHGQGAYALYLFDLMQLKGINPNKVTYTNILNAFTHAGMVDEGFQYFGYICQGQSSIQPLVDHYNVMVDLLGKAGRLNEAEDLIKKMPFPETVCTWTSMLDACRSHLDVERGERLAEHAFRMRPSDRAPHIMMHNIYASIARSDDGANSLYRSKDGTS
ncbi:hypothetical protein GOP47_0017176 [Adiantum capillus-veneris]|uniref:Pentatricopeptide repeat-containing protein n=1 Tax=Adiantum capillus-veneris TaxID=13818 RepID=A0A9D4ZDQ1_ADICA|nr:hypothetical protein GOP47_0017176 [Adiantum capillus-veneris]